MNSNSENPKVGKKFQLTVKGWFEKSLNCEFDIERKIAIGNPAKLHSFDIANKEGTVVVECKCYTWTETGNVPSAKMGFTNTIEFFGMQCIITVEKKVKKDEDQYIYFPLNDIYLKVLKDKFERYELVRNFITMSYFLASTDFPVTLKNLDDRDYWTCRVGRVGAAKNKTLSTFREKGITTMFMIERLLDATTIKNLRLPMYYKHNIYYLIYWMMISFDELRTKSNIDMANKRIRKNEYIVNSSLGKKINENINRLIEKRGKSRLNSMDTLLELFNFGSDIIISGMRNLNDLIKTDDIVNDNDFILDLAYSSKGPN